LQAHFSAIQVLGGNAGYNSSVQRLAPQQFYYAQGTFGLMSPQPDGYGFQPQFMSGVGTGFVTPNYLPPYHLQRHGNLGNRMGGRPDGNFQQVRHKQNQVLIP
jgi:polyadenylate-binding protein